MNYTVITSCSIVVFRLIKSRTDRSFDIHNYQRISVRRNNMLEYKYADRRKYTITSCNISIRIAGKSSLDENDKSIDSNNHQ